VTVLVDTGVLYALADAEDSHHDACVRWLTRSTDELLVPSLVIAEAAYLIGSRGGTQAEASFLDGLAPGGRFAVAELDPGVDLARVAELVRTYANLPLGTVDATVVATAERLGVREIATVDRRDFNIVRPVHVEAFVLLPDLG
jgi:predicted nucleic acid-binding protein